MNNGRKLGAWVLISALAGFAFQGRAADEPAISAPWYLSVGGGGILYEGDEVVDDGFVLVGRIGYDWSDSFAFEGIWTLAPMLDTTSYGFTDFTVENPEKVILRRAEKDEVWMTGLAADVLYHFTRWDRVDPYLAVGVGFHWYEEEVNDDKFDPALRVGGGVMYHFNDVWAVRADARTFVAGNDTEANMVVDAGLIWRWGAGVPPAYGAMGKDVDTDGDGLSDWDEVNIYKTDPLNPDTDGDGLTDGEEVLTYMTKPLVPDTDIDGLSDGQEVRTYKTNPLKRDTDDGGVADGHEVLEDGTDPLDGSDDLMLIELYIQFDWDKSIIKPQFYTDLDVIMKVLNRNPEASARIEGHADRNRKSKADHNQQLSQRRAEAVLAHLVDKGGIRRERLTAVGYGFSRPKAENDPQNGNPLNRRVEVYIRGAGQDIHAATGGAIPDPTSR